MIDFFNGLFIDLSLIGGIILFALSLTNKFRKYKSKMFVGSVVLMAIGLFFLDISSLSAPYQHGVDWATNK